LNPIIGCAKAAEIAKLAYETKRPVIDVAGEITGMSREVLKRLLDPARLTDGGLEALRSKLP
jgi:fumarate hydratase, class II